MYAFYNSSVGMIKIYYHGTDWQLVFKDGIERWFSVWSLHKMDSLKNAIKQVDLRFQSDLLVICEA